MSTTASVALVLMVTWICFGWLQSGRSGTAGRQS